MVADPRLVVFYPQVTMLRGRTIDPFVPQWPAKDPTHTLTHSADFTFLLPPSATITIATAEAVGDAVALSAITKTDTTVTFKISGGSDGIVASVAIKLLLSNGDVAGGTILLPIVAQAGAAALAAPGLSLPDNAVIDEVTGLPVIDPTTQLPIVAPATP